MSDNQQPRPQPPSILLLAWGILGPAMLLLHGIRRLVPFALQLRTQSLSVVYWFIVALIAIVMAYTEGYRVFHKRFVPRVLARAQLLANRSTIEKILAPLFSMSLLGDSKRQMTIQWCVLFGVIAIIIAVKQLSQPWRGAIDLGIIAALAWGVVDLVYGLVKITQSRTLR